MDQQVQLGIHHRERQVEKMRELMLMVSCEKLLSRSSAIRLPTVVPKNWLSDPRLAPFKIFVKLLKTWNKESADSLAVTIPSTHDAPRTHVEIRMRNARFKLHEAPVDLLLPLHPTALEDRNVVVIVGEHTGNMCRLVQVNEGDIFNLAVVDSPDITFVLPAEHLALLLN
jgi:hypothetical protein